MWKRYCSSLARREPGVSLALFRILVGGCLLIELSSYLTSDVIGIIWQDEGRGGFTRLWDSHWLTRFVGDTSPFVVFSFFFGLIFSATCLVFGWNARIASFVCLQLYLALMFLSPLATPGYVVAYSNALWLLTLARASETLSLDCFLRTRRWTSVRRIPSWPRQLVLVQLVVMYFFAGLQKVGSDWPLGGGLSAVYYTLQQPAWQRFEMGPIVGCYVLTQAATGFSWLWEMTSPLILTQLSLARRRRPLWRAYRAGFVIFGVVFHLSILLLLDIGTYSLIALAYYACLFSPREYAHFVRRRRSC